jgi:microcin C transport system permease protein
MIERWIKNPITAQRWQRFKSIKRGYYSFLGFMFLLFLALGAELFVNNRALMVFYEGQIYLPTYGDFIAGRQFGFDYDHEVNYRELQSKLKIDGQSSGFVIMPVVPYGPYENILREDTYPPFAPSIETRHYLGTDNIGRDVVARLLYGFRIAISFSLLLLVFNFVVGILVGSLMGYYGGWFDLLCQRVIEIWSNVPFLYVVIIISSIVVPNFFSLIFIMVFFGWMPMTWYLRTMAYKEKTRDYVAAARTMGASHWRILSRHIIPNSISLIVTFAPFAVVSGISVLTALDYLGFGLPAPTPSWGELLNQGKENLDAVWIVGSVTSAMAVVLMMITFIGEAVREAFDPRRHAYFE